MSLQFIRKFNSGSFIFKEGDVADCAFIIEKGKVQISVSNTNNDGDIEVETLIAGEIFGEMAIIDGLPRSASAVAIEDCEVSVITKELLNERILSSDPIVKLVISLLLKRIRNSNKVIKGDDNVIALENSHGLISLNDARERLKLENDLWKAVQRKEFILEYQPIVDLQNRNLLGFEGLIRWNSPERGRVRPDLFIDAAEQTSVIIPLGEWILEQGFSDLKIFQSELSNPDLFMSLNVSVRQLLDKKFKEKVIKAQKKTNTNPSQIKLEVTERIFSEGSEILDNINDVTALGYKFSLDDFGTGYSSLTSLINMHVGYIKVDRSFVSKLLTEPKTKTIVQAIIIMASEMGMQIVAEGIEKEEEAKILSNMGCQFGQGYLFSKPKSLIDLVSDYTGKKKAA